MRKSIPVFVGITAFLLAVVFILEFIGAIISLKDISSYSGRFYEQTKALLVFEMISAAIVVLSCLFVFYYIAKKREESTLYASLCVSFTLFTIRSIVDTFWAYSVLKTISSAPMPGIGIVKLVFLFITLIALVCSMWLQGSFKYDDKANIFSIIAMAAIFVCCIISFINMNSSASILSIMSIITLTLSIIIGVIAFVFSFINEGSSPKVVYRPGNVVYPHPKEIDPNSPSEQLRKLKELFDDGVITEEEYEEKRKKYVDKL